MKYHKILKSGLFSLPKSVPIEEDFRTFLFELLDTYALKISEPQNLFGDLKRGVIFDSGERVLSNKEAKTNSSYALKSIQTLIDSIKKCIDSYYNGHPGEAFNIMSEGMKNARIPSYLDKSYSFEANTNFYRIRFQDGRFPLIKKDLFHIPFQLRGKVKTQRFSISGYPCLYLSNSIYTAWEELGRPQENDIQATRLINTSKLKFLDLTNDFYVDDYLNHDSKDIKFLYKAITWPLVAACSIKVNNPSDTFKPEYIIPQLLLQWVNKKSIDGILYSSTHIDKNNSNSLGRFWNMAIPVKSNGETGYCPELQKLFKMTDVSTLFLDKIAKGGILFMFNREDIINPNIQQIDISGGQPYMYHDSPLGRLELTTNGLNPEEINF
ncbi:MAG: RES domain-containing protein, partial [Flavobacteriaceae bacterium]|nr:RES domain-containing protein [Flavobacteriaceae bacterium]